MVLFQAIHQEFNKIKIKQKVFKVKYIIYIHKD